MVVGMRGLSLPFFVGLAVVATAACDLPLPTERGAALFRDPAAGGGEQPPYSCAFCHDIDEPGADGFTRPGFPLRNAARRPSFWGGERRTLRDAANLCVTTFMLGAGFLPEEKDPDWRDLRRYLESLSDPMTAAAALTATLPRDCNICPDPECDSCAPTTMGADAVAGAAVYRRTCQLCHGEYNGGAGSIESAPRLNMGTRGVVVAGTSEDDPDNNPHHIAAKTRFGSFGRWGAPGEGCSTTSAAKAPPPGTAYHLACFPTMPPYLAQRLSTVELRDLIAFFYPGGVP